MHRILNTHDFILLLVQMMELKVWSRRNKNGKYFRIFQI
jgi:hypothetical protein